MGFRLGDREKQMFLPCSPGQERGNNDPGAQRQRETKGEVRVRVPRVPQSRKRSTGVDPVLPASATRLWASSLNHSLSELQCSHL